MSQPSKQKITAFTKRIKTYTHYQQFIDDITPYHLAVIKHNHLNRDHFFKLYTLWQYTNQYNYDINKILQMYNKGPYDVYHSLCNAINDV